MKIIILVNLGGPESLEEVKGFLLSLLGDPCVIRLPWYAKCLQGLLAEFIVKKRLSKSLKLYSEIGGASPIQRITQEQANKLSAKVNIPVHILMRHSKPGAKELLKELQEYSQITEIIVLPLYPHYSITTTESSFKQVKNFHKTYYSKSKLSFISDYYDHELFIKTWVTIIQNKLRHYKESEDIELIFSAHSIPESYITKYKDPYLQQLKKSVELIMEYFPNNSHILAFQSKFGKGKWLEPLVEDYMQTVPANKRIMIVPLSFVSEHVETIHEIGIQFTELAKKYNLQLIRIPTPNIHNIFIDLLADLIQYNKLTIN